MDFQLVLRKLIAAFNRSRVRYAVIGGFAMGVWGVAKATADIDFLVDREDLEKLHRIMTALGYRRAVHTENVSQYLSPLRVFGEIDFLHAFRKVSLKMLARAKVKGVLGGKVKAKVLMVEDIIGLKTQAIANDRTRRAGELQDIVALMALHHERLDWPLLRDYFALFQFEGLYERLREKYHATERR